MNHECWMCLSPKWWNIHPGCFLQSFNYYLMECRATLFLFSYWLASACIGCKEQPLPLYGHREAVSCSRQKGSHLSPGCSNGRLSGAFPDFFQKRSSLFGTGWDLSVPDLASWPVTGRHYRGIFKRQLSERSQGGLWFFFFLHVWTGRYKGSRSTWQPPELAALSWSVQTIWSIGHKQTFSWMMFVSVVLCRADWLQRH